MARRFFASESGRSGKVCGQIADAVLDAVMDQDPAGRVACEVCAKGNAVWIVGEKTSRAELLRSKLSG